MSCECLHFRGCQKGVLVTNHLLQNEILSEETSITSECTWVHKNNNHRVSHCSYDTAGVHVKLTRDLSSTLTATFNEENNTKEPKAMRLKQLHPIVILNQKLKIFFKVCRYFYIYIYI